MPNLKIDITDSQLVLIDDLIRRGRYRDADDVLRDGLGLIERREVEMAAKLAALQDAAAVGASAIDHGEFQDFATASDLTDHLQAVADRVYREVPDR